MTTIEQIKNHPVYKQILSDSFGGVMYDVANKYDTTELLELWRNLDSLESVNGIMKGVFAFLGAQK